MKKRIAVLEMIKWFSTIILFMIAIVGHYICRDYNFFLCNLLVYVTMLIAVCVAVTTKVGKLVVTFGMNAYIELQKVVWPTYHEALYTTFIVVVVTVLVSLILWGLDSLLVRLISFGLRL